VSTIVCLLALAGGRAIAQAPAFKVAPEVRVLLDQAQKQSAQYHYDEAIKILQSATEKAAELKDLYSQGKTWGALALAYYRLGNLPKAGELFAVAADWFTKAGDEPDEYGMIADVAVVKDNTGHSDEAKPMYLKVLEYARRTNNTRQVANACMNLASLDHADRDFSESQGYAQQALVEYRTLKDPQWEAASLSLMGDNLVDQQKIDEGVVLYRQALAICLAGNIKPQEGVIYSNLATVYRLRDELPKALGYIEQAISLYEEIKDSRHRSESLSELAVIYELSGQSRLAIQTLRESVDIAHQNGDRRTEAISLTNLGITYEQLEMEDEAEPALRQALALNDSIKDVFGQAACLSTLGSVERRKKEFRQADQDLSAAVRVFHTLGDPTDEATAIDALGGNYLDEGRYPEAIARFKVAIQMYIQAGNRRFRAASLGNIGLAELKEGKLPDAETHFRQSIAIFEDLRSHLGGTEESKAEFLGSRLTVYRSYMSLLIKRGNVRAAFDLAQMTKGRALLDLLNGGKISIEQDMTPAERDKERDLKAEADRLNVAMVKEGAENEVGAKKRFAAFQGQLRQAEDRLSALYEDLYARHPLLARKRAYKMATLAEIGEQLPDDTALLEYVVSDDPVVFVVTSHRGKASVVAVHLGISESNLKTQCAAFRDSLANPALQYQTLSQSLYKGLFSPVAPRLVGKKRLIVCPDGPLWDVPFAALSKGRFLAERYEIDYAYSATGVVAELSPRKIEFSRRPLLIVANPNFGGAKRFGDNLLVPGQRPIETPSRPIETPSRPIETPSRPIETPSRPIETPSRPIEPPSRDLATDMRAGIVDLPGTAREAKAIAKIYPDADVLTRDHAQQSAFVRLAGKYRYLHIASHAFFNDAAPMLSSIVLANPSSPDEDGFLTARTIFGMNLNADLVVLSACNTARGEKTSGEGIVGLSWALFAAGVPAQIVSQWSVDDQATATLMTRFYRNLKKGQPKGTALRNAELSFLKAGSDPKWRNPYYWAPFILLGDWR
jgi:CHAT domain-containing protein/Tfp pilus assembly protein PilF